MRRPRSTALAALLAAAAALTAVTAAVPAQAAPIICERFGGVYIQNNTRRVQNNVWGATTTQCIDVNQNGGFTVTQAAHNNPTNGAPAAYPSIYAGCHYAQCTSGSGLPMQASAPGFANVQTSVSMSYPSSGTWNAAYDLWFDPTPRTDGQNTGAEIMVWLNYQGSIQPVGSQVGTVNLLGATWQVWFGNTGWNVVSYRRTSPTNSISFSINTFLNDAISRGYAQRSWYLTSVQAGFEPWVGGTGLAVNSFSYTTSGSSDTTPPSTPQNLAVTGTTSSSASLSWSASTDNVGVAGYDILRAPGSSGGTFSPVGTATGTSFTDTGLTASTTYRYQVRARDAAGNQSGVSNTATAMTQSGGGGGNCTVRIDQWQTGYVVYVTVNGPRSGWSFNFALPSGHAFVGGGWNAVFTFSGQNVTAVNMSHNGNLASGQSTQWGFQASRPAGNTQLPTIPGCTVT